MPNLLDYKDSKTFIIYLFTGLLALAIYIYQGDQRILQDRDKGFSELIKTQNTEYTTLIQKECGQLVESFKELKEDQKEMRSEQRIMAIDIATLKVLKGIHTGGSGNGSNK